jgi:hypothetical protein
MKPKARFRKKRLQAHDSRLFLLQLDAGRLWRNYVMQSCTKAEKQLALFRSQLGCEQAFTFCTDALDLARGWRPRSCRSGRLNWNPDRIRNTYIKPFRVPYQITQLPMSDRVSSCDIHKAPGKRDLRFFPGRCLLSATHALAIFVHEW